MGKVVEVTKKFVEPRIEIPQKEETIMSFEQIKRHVVYKSKEDMLPKPPGAKKGNIPMNRHGVTELKI